MSSLKAATSVSVTVSVLATVSAVSVLKIMLEESWVSFCLIQKLEFFYTEVKGQFCSCFAGFIGGSCSKDVDECVAEQEICKNNGICINHPG